RQMLEFLHKEEEKYMTFMQSRAQQAMKVIEENGIKVTDFNYGDQGTIYSYLRDFSLGRYRSPDGARIQGALLGTTDWFGKKLNRDRHKAIADQYIFPLVHEMAEYDRQNVTVYRTAREVSKNFYAFGLLTDITQKLKNYREENNIMILADASKFLNGVINNSD